VCQMIHFSTPYRPLARCVRLTSAAGLQKRLDCTLCRLRGFHIHSRNAPITRTVKKRHLNSPLTPSGFPPMFRPTKPYVPRLAGDVKIFFNPTLSSPFFAGLLSYSVIYISEMVSCCALAERQNDAGDIEDHEDSRSRKVWDAEVWKATICGLHVWVFAQGAIVCAWTTRFLRGMGWFESSRHNLLLGTALQHKAKTGQNQFLDHLRMHLWAASLTH